MALYPTFDVPAVVEQVQEPYNKTKQSLYFDFNKGDFAIDRSGRLQTATPYETWIQWCLKTVYTQRWSCLAYSDQIGVELEEALETTGRGAQESYIKRTITEALLADPYGRTKRVYGFSFHWGADSVEVIFIVSGVWQEESKLTAVLSI